jgi:hypothetical protein
MRADLGKRLSAAELRRRMCMEAKPIPIKTPVHKVHWYRGYEIREWKEITPGAGRMCIIGLNDTGVAARRGLKAAIEWVDTELSQYKRLKPRIPGRRVKNNASTSRRNRR